MGTSSGNHQAFVIAAGKIMAMAATFVVPLFLTRFLDKNDYGLYAQFYTVLLFLAPILTWGIQSGLYYFYPTSGPQRRNVLVRNVYFTILFFGILFTALVNIPPIGRFLLGSDELYGYIGLLSICLILLVPTYIVEPLYVLRNDRLTTLVYPLAEVMVKMTAVIVMALAGGTLHSILIGVLVTHVFLFLFSTIYSLRGNWSGKILDLGILREQIAYSLPFGSAVLLNTLSRQFDKLVSIAFLTTTEFATYSIAFFGIPGIMQVYDSLCQVNVIDMTGSWQSGQTDAVLEKYRNFVVKTLSFSTPVILIVFLYAPQIVTFLFTEEYAGSIPYFRVFILTFIVGMLGAGTILRAAGKTNLNFRAFAISTVFTLPLTYLLIRYLGQPGAITGAVVSLLLPKFLQIAYEIKLLKCTFSDYFPWRAFGLISGISLLSIIPFAILEYIHPFNVYLSGVLALVYLIFTYLFMIRYGVFIVSRTTLDSLFSKLKSHING